MEWLEALKGFFSGTLKGAIKTTKTETKNSHNHTTNTSVTVNGNVLILNVQTNPDGLLPEDQLTELKKALLPEFEDGQLMFLQDDSQQLIGGYKKFKDSEEVSSLLGFFEGKISRTDMRLLESGLYEAHLMKNGQMDKAQTLKKQYNLSCTSTFKEYSQSSIRRILCFTY